MLTNSAVNLESIPQISALCWRKVSTRLVVRNTLRNTLTVAIVLGLFFGLMIPGWIPAKAIFTHAIGLFLFGFTLVLLVVSVIWPIFEVPRRGFIVRDHDFLYKQGIVNEQTFSIPFVRIQHAETTVNIFDRLVNLGSLNLYTSGARSAFLGFERDFAHELRAHILDRIRDLDEEMIDEDGGAHTSRQYCT